MPFEFIGGALCLDFVNTVHDSHAEDNEDELRAISDLLWWAKEAGLLVRAEHDRLAAHYRRNPREAAAALARSVAIRDLLLSLFAGVANGRFPAPQRLAELNSRLAEMPGLLYVRKGGGQIEAEWTSAADGVQQVLFAVLTDAARLLGSERLRRLRECASNDCTWLFLDETRNHSRRWCEMRACGNRNKARRHYQRLRAGGH